MFGHVWVRLCKGLCKEVFAMVATMLSQEDQSINLWPTVFRAFDSFPCGLRDCSTWTGTTAITGAERTARIGRGQARVRRTVQKRGLNSEDKDERGVSLMRTGKSTRSKEQTRSSNHPTHRRMPSIWLYWWSSFGP